ncbi:MAG: HAMP domain-containing protein [Phycisphaerae bacterium]|nr:HAMP domain-containing protein [Phycisphaerae bacterium]
MLRRTLMFRIGLLVAGFVSGAVVAIWLLQGALARIDQTNRDAAVLMDGIQAVGLAVQNVVQASTENSADLVSARAALDQAVRGLAEHPITTQPGGKAAAEFAALREALADLVRLHGPGSGGTPEALDASLRARVAILALARPLRAFVSEEQASLGRTFRTLVLGLTIAAMVMVNVAVVVLLRTAGVVLKPVGALVEGSRELAAEHFEHRVTIDRRDEFGELARAYNRLAEQLQANEERKAETLRQLAVTLNHDLNNALAVIEMQLSLLGREAADNPALASHFRDIRAALARMSSTIASLKNIRRVVLTDYAPGQKMLDLQRSVEPPTTGGRAA